MYKWANIRIVLSIFEVCRVTANSGVVWITFGVRLGPSNVCCMLLWWLVEAGLTAHWRPLYLSAKCWTPPSLAPGSPRPCTPRPWWAPAPAPAIASSPNCMLIWNGDKMKEDYYNFLQNDAAFCCNIHQRSNHTAKKIPKDQQNENKEYIWLTQFDWVVGRFHWDHHWP